MQNLKKLVAISALIFFATDTGAQEVRIQPNQVPAAISQFVRKHYPAIKITSVTQEKNLTKTEYDVLLDNGTKLEFVNNKIDEIEGIQRIPNSILPVKILRYIQTNYPNSYATEWKNESRFRQKVELNTGLELEFDRSGRFLKIDR